MNRGLISIQVLLYFLIMILMAIVCSSSGAAPVTISGTVSGEVNSGVTITLTGSTTNQTTKTDESGEFSFTSQANGTYTVTPSITSYKFSPNSSTVTVSGASVTNTDFTATAIKASTISKLTKPLTFTGSARICTWRQDKTAAYTFTFDDSGRSSHYLVAAPELEARGMRGTFYLNTKKIWNWSHWQKLFYSGHELGSHSWSHAHMGDLNEKALHKEFGKAKNDLLNNIKGMKSVSSFAYPYGSSSALVRSIAMLYHSNARSASRGNGINAADLSLDEMFFINCVEASGPPYDMNRLPIALKTAIKNRGWIVTLFHSVGANEESKSGTIPLSLFREHLDYVAGQGDKLWIATLGEVAAYIRARTSATLELSIKEQSILEVSILSIQVPTDEEVNLTVAIPRPAEWMKHNVVIEANGLVLSELAASSDPEIICDVPVNRKVLIWARK
jgi:peptidoglycan/xylan/chitin deacetylase (PgdA/CDA1 family)